MGQPQNQAQVQAAFQNSNPNTFAAPCAHPMILKTPTLTTFTFLPTFTYEAGPFTIVVGSVTNVYTPGAPVTGTAAATAIAALTWTGLTVANPSAGVVTFALAGAGVHATLDGPPGSNRHVAHRPVPNGALPTVANPNPTLITDVSVAGC